MSRLPKSDRVCRAQRRLASVVVGLGLWAPLAAATVAPLEGPLLTPAVVTLLGDQVLGDQVLADGKSIGSLVDIDWLEYERPSPAAAGQPASRFGVWLTDGSWLPASALSAASDELIRAVTQVGTHDVPLNRIIGWGVQELAPAADNLDRVLVASGPVDGRIQGLKDGKLLIATSLDPEPLSLDIGDVLGLRLSQTAKPAALTGTSLLATLDASRPPIRLRPVGDHLELVASGQPVSGPALRTVRLVVDGGRRIWLSNLAPRSVDEQGAFGVIWPWTRDSDLAGGPLLLNGVRYAKGLTVHSAAKLTWDLGGNSVRLRALVGISDAVAPEGDCSVTISGDGKVLWQRPRLRGSDAPVPLDLEVRGVSLLELNIGLGERFDIGDHVVLVDAYLVKK